MATQPGCRRDLDATEHERPAGPERMTVAPEPDPRDRSAPEKQACAIEIGGQGDLEVSWLTGNGTNLDPRGLQERRLIRPGLGARRRILLERAAEEAHSHSLRCLRQRKLRAVDGALDLPVGDVLDRLDDWHDRDRGTRLGSGGRDLVEKAGAHERSCTIVDQHDGVVAVWYRAKDCGGD